MTDAQIFNKLPNVSGLAGDSVTLVEGTSFAISGESGDIRRGGAEGLFFDDTRFVSCFALSFERERLEYLAVTSPSPFSAYFLARTMPEEGRADSTTVLERYRLVGNGMREEVIVRNLSLQPVSYRLVLEVDADFAHIFEVKEHRMGNRRACARSIRGTEMVFSCDIVGNARTLRVRFPATTSVEPGVATIPIVIPPRGEWRGCIEFHLELDGEQAELRYQCGEPVENTLPIERLRSWQAAAPRVESGNYDLDSTVEQSLRDLGALRIFDPEYPDRAVVAAGAPWFMTLFGRDSLWTSLMTLPVDPTLAVGTLRTLARLQGTKVDPKTDEEPGKILHEVRRGLKRASGGDLSSVYYGSIDATPLFVLLLGELGRWGFEDVVEELLPAADRALEWIDAFGDRDGDGFVEYARLDDRGLMNQGWKDSFDGVNFANGVLAEAPIALCEVQGYVYAAFIARAELARIVGDDSTAARFDKRAAELKVAFNERFWLEGPGWYALGLDRDKRPIDALASNMGHCLFTGIIDEEHAGAVATRLMGDEMFTGWGIRTLSTQMGAYNPVSYHNGSVWPHDSAICAAGLARYGFVDQARAVTTGLLRAAESFGGRLPELICGFSRDDIPTPVRYPTSCAPQAWSSASVFLLLRSVLLRLDVSVRTGVLWIAPCFPNEVDLLSVNNLPLAGSRLSVRSDGIHVDVEGLPAGMRVVHTERAVDA